MITMIVLAWIGAALLIVGALWDAFETIILPRRVTRRLRITRLVYLVTWRPWAAVCRRVQGGRREVFLSYFGPLALLLLLGIWAVCLVIGFALVQWALGSALEATLGGRPGFGTDIYMSGTTFFTLGIGDVVPRTGPARVVTVVESGTGFAFLALIIGYLPVLYQAFARREVNISLLDARAGSPPSATELLRRHGPDGGAEALGQLLHEWELWASELLESHLAYPSLAYFRSHHDNQSWVTAITTILDVCALILVGVDGAPKKAAKLTYAMARHAAVDLSQVLNVRPLMAPRERLSLEQLAQMRATLASAGVPLRAGEDADRKLEHLRATYEPFVCALAEQLLLPLPPWLPVPGAHDDWETSAWDRVDGALLDEEQPIGVSRAASAPASHFRVTRRRAPAPAGRDRVEGEVDTPAPLGEQQGR
jgi:Ion channel